MELAVDAGESDIRHLIEFFQRLHHAVADFGTGYFAVKIPLQALAYIVDNAVDIVRIDGAFVTGVCNTAPQFLPVKIFSDIAAFDNFQFIPDHTFKCGKTMSARQTLPAAAHTGIFPDRPGINHFIFQTTAHRATHRKLPFLQKFHALPRNQHHAAVTGL